MKQPPRPRAILINEIAALICEQPGLWLLEYRHDAGCEAQVTQSLSDCTCSPDISLVRPWSEPAARSEVRP